MHVTTDELKDTTIKIVGDPFVPEKIWLPACDRSQSTTMSLDKQPRVKPILSAVPAIVGFSSAVWAQALYMLMLTFLSGYIASTVTGIDSQHYMYKMSSDSGVFPQLLASSGFLIGWSRLTSNVKQAVRGVVVFLAALVGIVAILSAQIGTLPLIAIAVVSYLVLEYFGGMVQDALPRSVPAEKISGAFGLVNFIPAAFALSSAILCGSCCHKGAAGAASASCSGEGALFSSLAFVLITFFTQAVVLARSTRSTDLKACSALVLSFQAPIVFVIAYLAVSGSVIGFSSLFGDAFISFCNNVAPSCWSIDSAVIQKFWIARPLSLCAALAAMAFATVTGAAVGSLLNRHWTNFNRKFAAIFLKKKSESVAV